jgi:hypothetical protein
LLDPRFIKRSALAGVDVGIELSSADTIFAETVEVISQAQQGGAPAQAPQFFSIDRSADVERVASKAEGRIFGVNRFGPIKDHSAAKGDSVTIYIA